MWHILSIGPEDFHEPRVTERNLVTFLQAVENIYLENMIWSYPMPIKDYRAHGFMLKDYYYLECENDVLKIHKAF